MNGFTKCKTFYGVAKKSMDRACCAREWPGTAFPGQRKQAMYGCMQQGLKKV